jgi:hypothetical protein
MFNLIPHDKGGILQLPISYYAQQTFPILEELERGWQWLEENIRCSLIIQQSFSHFHATV